MPSFDHPLRYTYDFHHSPAYPEAVELFEKFRPTPPTSLKYIELGPVPLKPILFVELSDCFVYFSEVPIENVPPLTFINRNMAY